MTTLLARPHPAPSGGRGTGLEARFVWATAVIGGLLVVAAGSGLWLEPYGSETVSARNGYRGADLISLSLAAPLLGYAAGAARRGSTRGQLLWFGALGYVVYQYGYTFAYSWNRLFLVYLALLSLSAFTVTAAMITVDSRAVAARFDRATPTKLVAWFLTGIGVALGVMELGQIIPALVSGDTPQIIVDTAHPTSPVYILDLGLVVPLLLLTAQALRQRRPWSYIAAAILLVKGAAVGLGLLAANLFAALGDGKTDGGLNVLWAAIAGGSIYVLVRFLSHAEPMPPEATARLQAAGWSIQPEVLS